MSKRRSLFAPLSAQLILLWLEDRRQKGGEAETRLAKFLQGDLCGIGFIIGLKCQPGGAPQPRGMRFVSCLSQPDSLIGKAAEWGAFKRADPGNPQR
jgi:hypothetical protein